MIKISDFTPAISSNKEHTNTASCKVVINNSAEAIKTEKATDIQAEYPTVEPSLLTPTYASPLKEPTTELYKHLAIAFSNILKSNNPKLIANLIDQSGKVILSAEDLATAIALILGIDGNSVKISYEDPEATCLGKINPIKRISTIKVNGYDFNLAYNKQYNTLTDDFGISLRSCLIGI